MGFGSGGSNQTRPHTHDSNIINDGGALQFDNITQASLTSGDITYSDGSHLQRLAIGNPADSLVVSAGNLPEWGAGGGAWLKVGSDSGDKAALNVTGISGGDIFHILYQVEPSTISTNEYPRFRINGISSATYDCSIQNQYITGAPTITHNQTATGYFLDEEAGHTSELQYIGDVYLYKGISSMESTGNFMTLRGLSYRNDTGHMSNIVYGGGYQPDDSAITDISFTMSSGNISGSIQVNSLTYS